VATEQQRVIFYGNSVILAGMQAILEARNDFDVISMAQPLEQSLDEFRLMRPATVIFDMRATPVDILLPLLQQAGLQLIGIDPETHQALVWSGMQLQEPNSQQLVKAIMEYAGGKDRRQDPPNPGGTE
jgi:DNA-binding NarL/FixJ family response regulator